MFAAHDRRLSHRRATAPAVAALVLLTGGALSSCGFDAPTDRVNDIAAGANNRDASVDALGIRVLASAKGEGRLIGALVNNTAEDASLTGLSGADVTADFDAIEVPANGRVTLTDPETTPIAVSGDFTAGQVVELELEFDADGTETVTLNVPVVKNCHQYTQVPSPSASASEAGAAESPAHGDSTAAEGAHAEESHAEESHAEESHADDSHAEESHTDESHAEGEHEDATYVCDHPSDGAGH